MDEKVKVIVGADVCPIGRNLPDFRRGDANNIFHHLLVEFQQAHLSVVNLECPLIEQSTPIKKTGPALGVSSECINGLKKAEIDVVNLANNHILDHGQQGLINTLTVCAQNGITTVGAGGNLESARRILICDAGGIKIGILGVAEHEFSIATKNSCGANPLDLIDYIRNIDNNRRHFDYLIVLLHGGNEHYPFPSPRIKETCQFMVEMGANAVIVQHTHCPGCYQEYKNAHIVYGQGNLIFDEPNREKSFYEGFLVKLSISGNLNSSMDIIPYKQSLSHSGVRGMKGEEEYSFLQRIKERSSAIRDDSFVEAQWLAYCKRKKGSYLNRVFGQNYLFRKLASKKYFLKVFCTEKSLLRFQNTISCEAHREVLETLLNNSMI